MKYVLLTLCMAFMAAVLLSGKSNAAPRDDLYSCLDHGVFYAPVRGHSTPCPPPPPKVPAVPHQKHKPDDPDCIVKIPAM